MSVFNWFSRKFSLGPGRNAPAAAGQPARGARRSERSERREQLYGVVRDVMVRAGVLSASYKFKVLSLDKAGQRFVVMMDLARTHAGETARLSEIEAMLGLAAKARMGVVVSAVYWRISDQIGAASQAPAAAARAPLASRAADTGPAVAPQPAAAAVPLQRRRQDTAPYEPIDAQEMAAFKQAVAAAPARQGAGHGAPGAAAVQRSGPLLGPGAADRPSEFPHSEMGHLDLGNTQYGELR